MTIRDFRKKVSRVSARVGMFFSLWLVRVLPHSFFRGVMHFFSYLWYHGAKRLRKASRESLTIAFGPPKHPGEYEQITRQCFLNISHSMMDLVYYCFHPKEVSERFVVDGEPYLQESLARGKGVVLVTAHFGNFPLMLLELANRGYKPNVILRRARDPLVSNKIFEIMSGVGVKTIYSIPARESVKKSLQALRDNEVLCVLMDQNFGQGSRVFVEFFGQKAATATGPVVLAERTDAALVLVFTIREGNKYRLIFEPPVPLELRPDHDEQLTVNVARLTQIIERYIRRYPTEWGWMHRRWKSKETEVEAGEANEV